MYLEDCVVILWGGWGELARFLRNSTLGVSSYEHYLLWYAIIARVYVVPMTIQYLLEENFFGMVSHRSFYDIVGCLTWLWCGALKMKASRV